MGLSLLSLSRLREARSGMRSRSARGLMTTLGDILQELTELRAMKRVLRQQEAEILADERFPIKGNPKHYENAIYQINAPLAFIQQDMQSRMGLIRRAMNAADAAVMTDAERDRVKIPEVVALQREHKRFQRELQSIRSITHRALGDVTL